MALQDNMSIFSTLDYKSFLRTFHEKENRLTIAEKKSIVCYRGLYDFEFFARFFFSHYCGLDFSPMHYDFCKMEADPHKRGRREVVAAPRNHAKTTFKTLIKVIHSIVYGYEPYILILSYSKDEAKQKVLNILNELSSNPLLKSIYGNLAPVPGQTHSVARWGTQKFTTKNRVFVQAKSRLSSVRGLNQGGNRPSLIIGDDLESPERVLNPEQRLKTKEWFCKDILKLGQADNSTNIIVVGTCLHPDSLLCHLLSLPGWSTRLYKAMIHPATNQELWNQYKALYTDLSDPDRVETALAFYLANEIELLDGAEVLWPESDSYLKLIQMKIDEGEASFQSEKQNQPYDPERQILNMMNARYFKFLYNEQGQPYALQYLDASAKTVLLSSLEIVAFHDPALAETNRNDYAAIVVTGKDGDGYLYCLDVYLQKVAITRQLAQALEFEKKWGFSKLFLESNGFQRLLKTNYHDLKTQNPDSTLNVIPVTQHTNKQWRISTLEPYITNGHLLFSETLSPTFIEQLTQFPTHQHDDGPDALEGAISKLKTTPSLPKLSLINSVDY